MNNFERMNQRQINARMWGNIRHYGGAAIVALAAAVLIVCAANSVWGV